jgi:hypothetical protein
MTRARSNPRIRIALNRSPVTCHRSPRRKKAMARDNPITDAQKSCLEERADKPFPDGELTKVEAARMFHLLSKETGIGTETG